MKVPKEVGKNMIHIRETGLRWEGLPLRWKKGGKG